MSGRPLFSVVVPMYNVETFLPVCVESVLGQTLKDIEIILVDDGSPDRCGEMAEGYAARDPRVRVVHRPNGGLGPARNSGIEVARGEYVGFVDSDDWVEPDMYERLYAAAKHAGADAVFTGMKTVECGGVARVREHPYAGRTLRGSREIFQVRRSFYGASAEKTDDDLTPVSVCVAGYGRDFLNRHGLRFRNVRSEDKFFNTEACRVADAIACVAGAPYCYRKDNQPSITKTFGTEVTASFFELFRQLEQLSDEEPEEFRGECRLRASRCVIDYSRVLIRMIETSSADDQSKTTFVCEVLGNPSLRRACAGFPFWRLPIKQSVFYLCLRLRLTALARALTNMREVDR